MYVSLGKSSGLPTVSHCTSGRSNSAEPAAKPSAGSRKALVATTPAPWALSVMNRRRVTVSPSNAPGIPRSAVYFDLGVLRGSGTCRVSGRYEGGEQYRPDARADPYWAPRHAAFSASWSGVEPRPAATAPASHTAAA